MLQTIITAKGRIELDDIDFDITLKDTDFGGGWGVHIQSGDDQVEFLVQSPPCASNVLNAEAISQTAALYLLAEIASNGYAGMSINLTEDPVIGSYDPRPERTSSPLEYTVKRAWPTNAQIEKLSEKIEAAFNKDVMSLEDELSVACSDLADILETVEDIDRVQDARKRLEYKLRIHDLLVKIERIVGVDEK